MRQKYPSKITLSALVTFMFLAGISLALAFHITEVIHVGPIHGGGIMPPMQWSPNGDNLAYFYDGYLMLADTLGKNRPIIKVDWVPHRFRWVDDFEIIVATRYRPRRDSSYWRLSSINIITGEQSTIEEYGMKLGPPGERPPRSFLGPYSTVEGNAFYYLIENGDTTAAKFAASQVQKLGQDRLNGNNIMRTGTDAIYLVRADFTDSIKISNKPYKGYQGVLPLHISPNRKYVMYGGKIVRLEDDDITLLDTLEAVKEKPESTFVCGIGAESFNPKFNEVAFRLSCDDGHSFVIRRIGVYDYSNNEFTILDSLIELSNCNRPVYAANGKRMALIAEGGLYILNREVK